ncbi:MAG: alkaline phosphatase family protein [Thermoplasmata archaeon]|nr:alkaline phosphatase family protein [Thermoplasmata archaeon]
MRGKRAMLGLGIVVAMVLASVGPSAVPHSRHVAVAAPALDSESPQSLFAGPIHHVVVVVLENAEASNVLRKGPYLETLSDSYAYASMDYAVCHPSAPNYLAMTSGGTFTQCGSDTHHVFAGSNLGDLLGRKHESWAAFAQSMPVPCDTTNSYPYAVKHNPFVFYSDIVKNKSRCGLHDLPLTAWNADVLAGTIPNFALIVPNLKNDGHDTGIAYADTWLKGWLSPYLKASWFNSTVFFITFDEGTTNAGYNHLAGGHIYLVAVSSHSTAGTAITSNSSHYSLLTTIEWLLGLGSNGRNDKATLNSPLQELFTFA